MPCGFTVLELVVALSLVAILLALAVPGYRTYLQRAERADAVRALLAAAACQERIRAARGYYDTARCLDGYVGESYVLWFEPVDDPSSLVFTAYAEPAYPREGDACGVLSLDQAGTRGISGTARAGDCWGGQ